MKQLMIALCALALCAGCQKAEFEEDEPISEQIGEANGTYTINGVKYKRMTWKVGGIDTLGVTTRATLTDESMTDLWAFDGETLLAHQTSADDDFGTLSLVLEYGEHSLSFVASRGEGGTYADGVLAWTKVKPTYGLVKSINIVGATRLEQSVSLDRIDAQLKLTIEDEIPTGASSDLTIAQHYMGIKAEDLTGASVVNDDVLTYDWSAKAGMTGCSVSYFGFTPTPGTEYSTDLTVRMYNASGTLATHTATVPLLSNRCSNLHGSFFQASNGTTISLNTTMLSQYDQSLY